MDKDEVFWTVTLTFREDVTEEQVARLREKCEAAGWEYWFTVRKAQHKPEGVALPPPGYDGMVFRDTISPESSSEMSQFNFNRFTI